MNTANTTDADVRLGAIARRLGLWCETETYYSDRDVYSWSRSEADGTELGTEYVFTVRVGMRPHQMLSVTSVDLDILNVDELIAALDTRLAPLEVPEARKAEQR